MGSLLIVMLSGAQGACGPTTSSADAADPASEARPVFPDVFQLDHEITLEEEDTALITGIDWLAVDEAGRLAIPDPIESQVRVYGPDGRLLANLGRLGEGPGEFQQPRFTAFSKTGSLYVAESGSPRITRFTASLKLDTVFAFPEAQKVHGLAAVPGGFAIGHIRGIAADPGFTNVRDSAFVHVYDISGRRTASFYRIPDPIFDVPYWLSATLNMGSAGYLLAARGERIIAGTSLLFPLVEFTVRGERIGKIHRPLDWPEISRPERGAFRPPNQMAKFQVWMRSFTTIHRVALLDDGPVLVVRRTLDPEVLAYEEATYHADLYNRDGVKLWKDVVLPGDLLMADGRRAYLLTARAPAAWTIAVYELAG